MKDMLQHIREGLLALASDLIQNAEMAIAFVVALTITAILLHLTF